MFRLTYFVSCSTETDRWNCQDRYEVWGSGEAICNLYYHLCSLSELQKAGKYESACPNFIEIYTKDGLNVTKEYKKHGNMGVISREINTFK